MRARKRKRSAFHTSGFDNRLHCFYCGQRFVALSQHPREQTLDHVYPKHLGGSATGAVSSNLVFCCRECNERKGGMHPREWGHMIPDEALPRYVRRLKEIFGIEAWEDIDWWHTSLLDAPRRTARQG